MAPAPAGPQFGHGACCRQGVLAGPGSCVFKPWELTANRGGIKPCVSKNPVKLSGPIGDIDDKRCIKYVQIQSVGRSWLGLHTCPESVILCVRVTGL